MFQVYPQTCRRTSRDHFVGALEKGAYEIIEKEDFPFILERPRGGYDGPPLSGKPGGANAPAPNCWESRVDWLPP